MLPLLLMPFVCVCVVGCCGDGGERTAIIHNKSHKKLPSLKHFLRVLTVPTSPSFTLCPYSLHNSPLLTPLPSQPDPPPIMRCACTPTVPSIICESDAMHAQQATTTQPPSTCDHRTTHNSPSLCARAALAYQHDACVRRCVYLGEHAPQRLCVRVCVCMEAACVRSRVPGVCRRLAFMDMGMLAAQRPSRRIVRFSLKGGGAVRCGGVGAFLVGADIPTT